MEPSAHAQAACLVPNAADGTLLRDSMSHVESSAAGLLSTTIQHQVLLAMPPQHCAQDSQMFPVLAPFKLTSTCSWQGFSGLLISDCHGLMLWMVIHMVAIMVMVVLIMVLLMEATEMMRKMQKKMRHMSAATSNYLGILY